MKDKNTCRKEKIFEILFIVLIFITLLSIVILRPLDNLDEIWNYNLARNICDGLVPYKDFNMIITPIWQIVCGIILKITMNELIVMRIISVILGTAIFYLIYKIFKVLDIKKDFCIIFTIFIFFLLKKFVIYADYNIAILCMTLIIIYIELKNLKEKELLKCNYKIDILLGILGGISFGIKQTVGAIICIVLLLNRLNFVKHKNDFKICSRKMLYRIIGIIISILPLILYLIINKAFIEFINYTILGIREFSNKSSYLKLIRLNFTGILAISVPVTTIFGIFKTIIYKEDNKIYIILVYGIALFSIVFPISDITHFIIGLIGILIILLYYISQSKAIKNRNNKIYIFIAKAIKIVCILLLIFYSFINIYTYFKKYNINISNLKHFRYIPIDEELEKNIEEVDQYINNKEEKVIILDTSAAVYMIPIDKYNKDYDMLNIGNLGLNGERKIIKEISQNDDTIYLVLKEVYKANWQMPTDITNYVKENKEKIGDVYIFDIYK